MFKQVVVIGASAGGVEALRDIVSALPSDLDVPVFVVLHIPPYTSSSLPQILSRFGPLEAVHPEDETKFQAGTIYVAPPDHHMLVTEDSVLIKRGPKENRFRPSIDALFRSAAYVFGARTIGVVLSGVLEDGTSGLWSIKRLGGTSVVQDPDQARFESMPRSAMDYVKIDYKLPSSEIGSLLARLTKKAVPPAEVGNKEVLQRMELEMQIATANNAFQRGIMKAGELTPFTCPECHGALVRIVEGKMSRFRCHTGHAYSDSALLEAVMESTGEMVWQVIRSYEEGVMLLNHMADHLHAAGDHERSDIFREKANDLEERSKLFHAAVLRHESLSGDNLGQ